MRGRSFDEGVELIELIECGGDDEPCETAEDYNGFDESEKYGYGTMLEPEVLLLELDSGLEDVSNQACHTEGEENIAEVVDEP